MLTAFNPNYYGFTNLVKQDDCPYCTGSEILSDLDIRTVYSLPPKMKSSHGQLGLQILEGQCVRPSWTIVKWWSPSRTQTAFQLWANVYCMLSPRHCEGNWINYYIIWGWQPKRQGSLIFNFHAWLVLSKLEPYGIGPSFSLLDKIHVVLFWHRSVRQ